MKNLKKLVLLHSNDLHGDFLAEKVDRKLLGGVSRLSGYVRSVRLDEPNTLYCIAGDMFRGSVIDSEYRGLSTIEIMNMLEPDVVTIGNHEVDYGIAHLLFIEKCAKFPIINANFYIRTNNVRMFRPYLLKEIGGMRILFIGVLTEEVLAQTKSEGLIGSFVDINEAAREVGRICNAHNSVDVDLTVLLTHIGFESDKKLAAQLDPAWGVDLIIGGHSHTLPDAPAVVNGIPIVQAGVGTDNIGRFDIEVDTDSNRIDSYKWQIIPIDEAHCPRDPALEELIDTYKKQTDAKYGRIITRFVRPLTHPCRNRETELGDLFADILRDSLGVNIMLVGSGSIRSLKFGDIVRYNDLMECFPYDDALHMISVTGAQLKRMMLFMLRDEALDGDHTEFYQFSKNMRIKYRRADHSLVEMTVNGKPVDDSKQYTVGIQDYHFKNFEEFFSVPMEDVRKNMKPRSIATSGRDILEEYLGDFTGAGGCVGTDGRLTII